MAYHAIQTAYFLATVRPEAVDVWIKEKFGSRSVFFWKQQMRLPRNSRFLDWVEINRSGYVAAGYLGPEGFGIALDLFGLQLRSGFPTQRPWTAVAFHPFLSALAYVEKSNVVIAILPSLEPCARLEKNPRELMFSHCGRWLYYLDADACLYKIGLRDTSFHGEPVFVVQLRPYWLESHGRFCEAVRLIDGQLPKRLPLGVSKKRKRFSFHRADREMEGPMYVNGFCESTRTGAYSDRLFVYLSSSASLLAYCEASEKLYLLSEIELELQRYNIWCPRFPRVIKRDSAFLSFMLENKHYRLSLNGHPEPAAFQFTEAKLAVPHPTQQGIYALMQDNAIRTFSGLGGKVPVCLSAFSVRHVSGGVLHTLCDAVFSPDGLHLFVLACPSTSTRKATILVFELNEAAVISSNPIRKIEFDTGIDKFHFETRHLGPGEIAALGGWLGTKRVSIDQHLHYAEVTPAFGRSEPAVPVLPVSPVLAKIMKQMYRRDIEAFVEIQTV